MQARGEKKSREEMEEQQSLNVEEGEDDFEQRMLKKIREVL